MVKIVSWNVNGVRSVAKKGFLEWLSYESPDICCLQEIKAHPDDLDSRLMQPFGYSSHWFPAQKKGYSGTAIYTKKPPLNFRSGMGIKKFDIEGRVLVAEFSTFVVINTYFPNSQRDHARLGYKLEFCEEILKFCEKFRKKGLHVVLCGDFNIAHKEIDLKNPKTNVDNAGFLPEERAWMDIFIKKGYVDTFRNFNSEGGQYTWWSFRPGVREKNIGWRLDYHLINKEFLPSLKSVAILGDVKGSDHCPVVIEVDV